MSSNAVGARTPLRAAMFGAGMIGAIHRRASEMAGATIVGVMDATPERSRAAAADWETEAILSPEDLARLAPDVVHVCTPNQLHPEHVQAALECGAHVICEKPLAVENTVAQQLLSMATTKQRVATIPFVYRYHPLVREIRARRIAGEFGPWHLLHGSYLQDWLLSPQSTSWRVDASQGGASRAFADIGSHWCDLMEFVTGERIKSVMSAMTITIPERPASSQSTFGGESGTGDMVKVDTEDAATVLFRTESGVLGSVIISQVSAGRKNRLWFEFDGAHKSAVFDQESPETIWLGTEDGAEILQRDPNRWSPEQRRLSKLPAGHPQGYAQCFENFISDTYSAIRGEVPDGLPTFVDGARSTQIVDAVIASSRTHSWTDVEPVTIED